MKNTLTLTRLTIQEAFARKSFFMFFALSSLVLLIFIILFLSISTADFASIKIEGKEAGDMLAQVVEGLKVGIIVPLYGGGLFLAIFSVSSFIPNMVEKGNIDVLLSKPISRSQLIWGKFFGGIVVVLINVAYVVIGIWILLGAKFGAWDASFLMTIPTITFTFAVLYSLIILVGILWQNSIMAMMLTYLIFFIFSPVLNFRDKIILLVDSKFVEYLLNGLYYLLPKTSELGEITGNLAQGSGISDYQPIISSFLFMILSLALSIFIFSKKDY